MLFCITCSTLHESRAAVVRNLQFTMVLYRYISASLLWLCADNRWLWRSIFLRVSTDMHFMSQRISLSATLEYGIRPRTTPYVVVIFDNRTFECGKFRFVVNGMWNVHYDTVVTHSIQDMEFGIFVARFLPLWHCRSHYINNIINIHTITISSCLGGIYLMLFLILLNDENNWVSFLFLSF